MSRPEQAIDRAASQGRLLKVDDVCDRLQMGRSKVFELIVTGQLDSVKIDGSRRVTEQQLADFIERMSA